MFDFGEPISADPLVLERHINIGLIPLLLAIVAFIVNVAFAIAVFKDASARRRVWQHLWFVSPIFWAGATLVGSVFVAGLYWAMHYSTLASKEQLPVDRPWPPKSNQL